MERVVGLAATLVTKFQICVVFYSFTFTYDFPLFGECDKKGFVLWENSTVAKHTELGWVQSSATHSLGAFDKSLRYCGIWVTH